MLVMIIAQAPIIDQQMNLLRVNFEQVAWQNRRTVSSAQSNPDVRTFPHNQGRRKNRHLHRWSAGLFINRARGKMPADQGHPALTAPLVGAQVPIEWMH